jgi:hypothetical protein
MHVRYRSRDDRGLPTRVKWVWFLPQSSDRRQHWVIRQLLRTPELVIPPAIFASGIAVFVILALREGPAVVAVTLFSPISSTLIFSSIALLLWLGRAATRHTTKTRELLKQSKRCPGCLYNLRGLDPGIDALTTCPECSSAWDLREKHGTETIIIRADGTSSTT